MKNTNADAVTELHTVMTDALYNIQEILEEQLKAKKKSDYLSLVMPLLMAVIVKTTEIAETRHQGLSKAILGSLHKMTAGETNTFDIMQDIQSKEDALVYSISKINPNDQTEAMNYLGQRLADSIHKHLLELPLPLQNDEMRLRGIEALLSNVLNSTFDKEQAHNVLDQFNKHVHMVLDDYGNAKI